MKNEQRQRDLIGQQRKRKGKGGAPNDSDALCQHSRGQSFLLLGLVALVAVVVHVLVVLLVQLNHKSGEHHACEEAKEGSELAWNQK